MGHNDQTARLVELFGQSDRLDALRTAAETAAVSPAGWRGVLDACAALMGEQTSLHLQCHDHDANVSLGVLCANYDPALLTPYLAHYAAINPWLHAWRAGPPDAMIDGARLIDRAALERTEFWADYLRPNGDLSAALGLPIAVSAGRSLVLSANMAWRRAEPALDRTRLLFAWLRPALQSALAIQGALGDAQARGMRGGGALEAADRPVILLDRHGRAVARNHAAEPLLGPQGPLRLAPGDRLAFAAPQSERRCAPALAALIAGRRRAPFSAMLVDRDGGAWRLTAAPTRGPAWGSDPVAGYLRPDAPVVALILQPTADAPTAPGPDLLSARETQALTLLAQGLMTERIAAAMGVSSAVAARHLARARDKLGARTREQALAMAIRRGLI